MADRVALIVTGTHHDLSRADRETIRKALLVFVGEHGGYPKVVIHGACKTGVEAFVHSRFRAPMLRVPADWHRHGQAAGPVRNTALVQLAKCLREGSVYDVRWLAFPRGSSPGTRDCARKLEAAGFSGRVVELEP